MKTPKVLFALLAVILLSACDNNERIEQPFENHPITVTADINQHTKAGYENGVLMPEKFIIDINQGSDSKYNYSLVEMTKSAEGNTYSAPAGTELLWASNSYTATVKAMTVPFGLTTVAAQSVMTVKVSVDQDNEDNVAASDLLGASSNHSGDVTISSGNINIKLQHLLSKLDVKYEFSDAFEGNNKTINSLTLKNICTTGGFSYANMALDATNLKYGDVKMFHNTSESKAEAIFFPYNPTVNPTLLISATIDGKNYDFSCPVVPKDAEGFITGKRYTMTVTIVGTSVSGTNATIAKGWDSNTEAETFVTE